jgi:hypothetical protein
VPASSHMLPIVCQLIVMMGVQRDISDLRLPSLLRSRPSDAAWSPARQRVPPRVRYSLARSGRQDGLAAQARE